MTIHPQRKHLGRAYNLIAIMAVIFGVAYVGYSFAVTTDTTLGITAGTFSFSKDITTDMSSYFGHPAHLSGSINIGTYAASASAQSAQSSGDHRFTVSDLLGASFTVTLQSSTLTASGVTPIPAANITYTGSERLGTGYALTATGTQNTSLASPVTFVARANTSGLSLYAQEITLKVTIPGSAGAGSYTGVLTFTY